ncbi:hypothetical protein PV703_23405 [Streptomyces sp. ME01-24h]|nr:hypothetical protein [Streptomyces sp. ME19-03-3]MDX3356206.1 hypothetical protein [Streptomyces sp. ME01-24h]
MEGTRTNRRRYALSGLVAAATVAVAIGLGAPPGAVFILAVALAGPLLMLVMLHALRGSEAHRGAVLGALHGTATGGTPRGRGTGAAAGHRGPGDRSGPGQPGSG